MTMQYVTCADATRARRNFLLHVRGHGLHRVHQHVHRHHHQVLRGGSFRVRVPVCLCMSTPPPVVLVCSHPRFTAISTFFRARNNCARVVK
jgi:hypothetical protein